VLQRGAKLHRRKGGGSLTLLLVLPGLPARGEAAGDRARILTLGPNSPAYRHLSAAQRAKLAAALAGDAASAAAPGGAAPQEGCMRTEVRPAGGLAGTRLYGAHGSMLRSICVPTGGGSNLSSTTLKFAK